MDPRHKPRYRASQPLPYMIEAAAAADSGLSSTPSPVQFEKLTAALLLTLREAASRPEKLAYTIAEAVTASGIGRSFLYNEIKLGRIAVRKAGKHTLILREELIKYLNNS